MEILGSLLYDKKNKQILVIAPEFSAGQIRRRGRHLCRLRCCQLLARDGERLERAWPHRDTTCRHPGNDTNK